MRRRGWSGSGAIFDQEHFLNFFRAVSTQAHFNQRADHDPHHLPEKSAALYSSDYLRRPNMNFTAVNRPHGVFAAMPGTGE